MLKSIRESPRRELLLARFQEPGEGPDEDIRNSGAGRASWWWDFGGYLSAHLLALAGCVGVALVVFGAAPDHGGDHPLLVAATIGLSIVLAAAVTGGFALLLARVKATTALMRDVTDLQDRLQAMEGALTVIHRFRESHRPSG